MMNAEPSGMRARALVLGSLSLLLGLVPIRTGVANLMCFGRAATIVGTPDRDRLIGTPGSDVIVGLGGRDEIEGGDGNDFICSGAGEERAHDVGFYVESVVGGPGDDRIDGQAEPNDLFGGSGNDYIRGGSKFDFLNGGAGNDILRAGPGEDHVTGAAGHDLLILGPGHDTGSGSEGNDEVRGGSGPDSLGSENGFTCAGDSRVMTCDPGGLDDVGNDSLHGGRGNDLIAFGHGDDLLDGGRGRDEATFSSWSRGSSFVADLKTGKATGAGKDVLRGVEDLSGYSRGTFSLFGDGGKNQIAGGSSRGSPAQFIGRGGKDIFVHDSGLDKGAGGNLTVYAGAGRDRVDFLVCTLGGGVSHTVIAGRGNDVVLGSCAVTRIEGGPGDDKLLGGEGDTVDGGPGEDNCRAEFESDCKMPHWETRIFGLNPPVVYDSGSQNFLGAEESRTSRLSGQMTDAGQDALSFQGWAWAIAIVIGAFLLLAARSR